MNKALKMASFLGLSVSLVACGTSSTSTSNKSTSNPSTPTNNTANQQAPASSEKGTFTKEKPAVIRAAHQLVPDSPMDKTFKKFKEVAESKSEGRIKVDIYPSGQLYSEKEIPAQVSKGTLEMGMASASLWSTISPLTAIFDVPYLYENYDQAHQFIDGVIGKTVSAEMEKVGAKTLVYPDYGFVHMSTSKVPSGDGTKPEDYKGLKVRVLGKMSAAPVQKWGGAPVFMGGNEVYLALQKKTVDAAFTGLTSMDERKYYDVQNTLVLNKISNLQFITAISTKFYNSLPADLQKIVDEAAMESQKLSRATGEEEEKQALAALSKKMKVIEIKDLGPWKKLNEEAKKLYTEQTGETGKKLLEEAAKISK